MSGKSGKLQGMALKDTQRSHAKNSSRVRSARRTVVKPTGPPPAPPSTTKTNSVHANTARSNGDGHLPSDYHDYGSQSKSSTLATSPSTKSFKRTDDPCTSKTSVKRVSFSEDNRKDNNHASSQQSHSTTPSTESTSRHTPTKTKPLQKSMKSYPAPKPPISKLSEKPETGESANISSLNRENNVSLSGMSELSSKSLQHGFVENVITSEQVSPNINVNKTKTSIIPSDESEPTGSGTCKYSPSDRSRTPSSSLVTGVKNKPIMRPCTPPPKPPHSPTKESALDHDSDDEEKKKTRRDALLEYGKIVVSREVDVPESTEIVPTVTVTKALQEQQHDDKSSPQNPCHHKLHRRQSSTFPLGWCCGLGRNTCKTPPLELPLRSAGPMWGSGDVTRMLEMERSYSGIMLEQTQLSACCSDSNSVYFVPEIPQTDWDSDKVNSDTKTDPQICLQEKEKKLPVPDEKPVVYDVKIVKLERSTPSPRGSTRSFRLLNKNNPYENSAMDKIVNSSLTNENYAEILLREQPRKRCELNRVRSQSVEDMTDLVVNLDLDLAGQFERNKSIRSSFVGDNQASSKPAILRPPSDFQTILKHSSGDKVYALPQPQCYSEETLRAVKSITEKYDTLQRWKQRAQSFRDSAFKIGKFSRQNSKEEAEEDQSKDELSYGATLTRSGHIIKQPLLSERECNQIEFFYRSHATQVYICPCEADIFYAAEKSSLQRLRSTEETSESSHKHVHKSDGDKTTSVACSEWQYKHTGIPVWVLNTGKAKRPRELLLIVAERQSSFPLWKDRINYLSQYTEVSPGWHTLHLSDSLLQVAGLRFSCAQSALEFLDNFKAITADPNDDLWKVHLSQNSTRNKHQKKKKLKPLIKEDISNPCHFSHINTIGLQDIQYLRGLGNVSPEKLQNGEDAMRPRAYSG